MSLGQDMSHEGSGACLSDRALDRLVTEEAGPEERMGADQHTAVCPRCRERLTDFQQAQADFAQHAPPLAASALSAQRLRRPSWVFGGLALASAACAWLVLRPAVEQSGGPIRTKGAPRLGFYVKRGERVFEGATTVRLALGDELRFQYSSQQSLWLAVLGVDAARKVSVYYPALGPMQRVAAGRKQLLPEATELDDTIGEEALLGVFCETERDLTDQIARLTVQPDAAPGPACSVDRIRVTKGVTAP